MAANFVDRYEQLVEKANKYHEQALWEEKLRCLQEALALCDERKQGLLYDMGGIWRRLGQFDKAKQTLQNSLSEYPDAGPLFKATVQGELGTVARHRNNFLEAQQAFREQRRLAAESSPSLEADAEICRAIGNEGMANYNIWQHTTPKDHSLLATAITQMEERISRAQELQNRIRREDPKSKYLRLAETWETIGLDRLSVLYIAKGHPEEAVRFSTESQQKQKRKDPTVTAFSKFFHGNALWHNGQKTEALREWNAPRGICSSPMALCKEPSEEHNEYLRLMAGAGVDFDTFDEGGFTALDHASLGTGADAEAAVKIIEEALRNALLRNIQRDDPEVSNDVIEKRVNLEVSTRRKQAQLRRQYRTLLQEFIRPELRVRSSDSFRKLRSIYAKFVSSDAQGNSMFSNFRYVKFLDFKNHGKLPKSTFGLAKEVHDSSKSVGSGDDDFVIFFSYRWLGGDRPDDSQGKQWRRMVDAAEGFLKVSPHIQEEHLGLWLDYACVDQEDEQERQRGIDALPLAVIQCNALISLTDKTYHERAWCTVEVMLIRALQHSYGLHQWWEHDGVTLQEGNFDRTLDVRKLKLTKEKLDRPKIDFLLRQSKLLGKDDA